MGLTNVVLIQFESSNMPTNFNTWGTDYKGWSVRNGILFQFMSIPLWMLVGIYLEAVAPREYGKPLKPWFFVMPSFWCPRRISPKNKERRPKVYFDNLDESAQNHTMSELNVTNSMKDLQKEQIAFETKYMNPDFYEPVPAEISKQELNNTHLKIKDLQKEYKNGFKAVKGINL